MSETEETYCVECNGTRIQRTCWYRPNTGKVLEDFADDPTTGGLWCEDCREHTQLDVRPARPTPPCVHCCGPAPYVFEGESEPVCESCARAIVHVGRAGLDDEDDDLASEPVALLHWRGGTLEIHPETLGVSR